MNSIEKQTKCWKFRLYPLESGRISIDGRSIEQTEKKIAFVPQEPSIFAATVRENLCMGSFIDSVKIDDACKMANIFGFIQTLPEVNQ